MLPFRKVVFPVDYSEPCRAMVPYVQEVIRRFDAQLTLVHAYGSETISFGEMALALPKLPDDIAEMETNRLVEFANKEFPVGDVDLVCEPGDPAQVIHDQIQHSPADLVMLPTHGRGLARRLLLGSVTAKVLHDVSAAVWTATAAALSRGETSYKSVLCACDLDDAGERDVVIKAGAAMAKRYGASLSLIHILELTPMAMEVDYASFRGALMESAHKRMEDLKRTHGIDAPHRVIDGSVATAVHQEAVRTQADLIVTGRGRQQETLGRAWSSLYQIVREAPCPVLSI